MCLRPLLLSEFARLAHVVDAHVWGVHKCKRKPKQLLRYLDAWICCNINKVGRLQEIKRIS